MKLYLIPIIISWVVIISYFVTLPIQPTAQEEVNDISCDRYELHNYFKDQPLIQTFYFISKNIATHESSFVNENTTTTEVYFMFKDMPGTLSYENSNCPIELLNAKLNFNGEIIEGIDDVTNFLIELKNMK